MNVPRVARGGLSLLAVVGLLGVALPRVTGVEWHEVAALVGDLTVWQICLLVGLWLAGLLAYTFVATAALPRLTHRQALALNLSGSAVANLVPFGGALGMGLNYRMVMSWGHAKESFAPFTALTSILNVVAKLTLPLIAIGLLLARGGLVTPVLQTAAVVAAAALSLVLVPLIALLLHERSARLVARFLQRIVVGLQRLVRTSRRWSVEQSLLDARHRVVHLLRARWGRMLVGMIGYGVLQALLLWLALSMLGSTLGMVQVFTGFAFGRVLTLLVVTPGGVGISETGSVSLLVALGGDPAVVAAGTLLFSALTFALEIPVGGLWGLCWWRSTGRRAGGVQAA
ncbi:MAG: hypothetical protein JWL64_997 [Frankiales bacterium]|nr:hypothetical protein [Frankiales bacterium]